MISIKSKKPPFLLGIRGLASHLTTMTISVKPMIPYVELWVKQKLQDLQCGFQFLILQLVTLT